MAYVIACCSSQGILAKSKGFARACKSSAVEHLMSPGILKGMHEGLELSLPDVSEVQAKINKCLLDERGMSTEGQNFTKLQRLCSTDLLKLLIVQLIH
jgi:hypothetical protein